MLWLLVLLGELPGACATAACWEAAAEQAAALGSTDVAAGRRGEAFRCEPDVVRLGRWIDGLLAGGEVRRAHAGLAEAWALAERRGDEALKTAAIGMVVPAVRDGPVSPGAASPKLRAAYAAMHAGRWQVAANGFAGVSEAYHRVFAGVAERRRGNKEAARRSWAAARAGFYDAGAKIEIAAPMEWKTTAVAWQGEALVELQAADFGEFEQVSRVRVRGRSMLLPVSPVLALTADGQLLRAGTEVALQDVETGVVRRTHAEAEGVWRSLLASGTGDDLVMLVHGSAATSLWKAGGTEPVVRWRDDAADVTAVAMSADGRLVARGMVDSRVRVHEPATGLVRVLELAWQPAQARDVGFMLRKQNPPVALRFDGAGRLIAVHAQGEIAVWDARSGALLRQHAGDCTPAEVRLQVKDPWSEMADEQQMCGRAEVASVASDGETVVVGDHGLVRVRSTKSGRTLRHGVFGPRWGSFRALALADAGTVAVVDMDGLMTVWSSGGVRRSTGRLWRAGEGDLEVVRPQEPEGRWAAHVEGTRLVADGRVLRFAVGDEVRLWDVVARRSMTAARRGEVLLALSTDARFAAVAVAGGLQIREVASGRVVYRRTWAAHEQLYSVQVANSGHAVISVLSDRKHGYGGTEIVGPDWKVVDRRFANPLELSDDGQWIVHRSVGFSGRDDMHLTWLVSRVGVAGRSKPVHKHSLQRKAGGRTRRPAERVVFSRDATRIVWSEDEGDGAMVWTQSLAATRADRSSRFTGKLVDLAFSADGSEVLLLGEGGRFVRWAWATGERREHAEVWATTVTAAADGKVLLFGRNDRVEIRGNDVALRRIAEVRPLTDGGWAVIGAAGAVDGSDGAEGELVTIVRGSDATLVFGGELGWDGAFVDGTLARALGGEVVRPPVLVRPEGP